MAWSFGDSFDLYATGADMANGYWDTVLAGNISFVAGRFTGSQAIAQTNSNAINLTKSSGVNDPVHHFVVSFRQTATITGTSIAVYLQLQDAGTAQCSIVFRSDGAILLTSGGSAGTVLATYTGAFPVVNTWYAFEFEVVINSTTGSIAVRKNGNNVNDFFLGSLNTRGGTANNYANKLQIGVGASGVNHQDFDDLFWQSSAATGTWLGDIRCYTRMPVSDQSVAFSKSPTTFGLPPYPSASINASMAANAAYYAGFTSQGGSVSSVAVTFAAGYTGNLKCALFATAAALGASGSIGAILGTATASIANPVTGVNTFTFSPAVSIASGTPFYVGVCSDTSSGTNSIGQSNAGPSNAVRSTTTYASFPVASAAVAAASQSNFNFSPIFTAANFLYVSEAQQDGLSSYVFDSNPGDADFYGVASIASTPAVVIATTVRGYMQKSDAGTRTAAVQLKSGATTVASSTLTLTTSGWLWAWRIDLTDPNTGAAWTAAAVNAAQIGPTVIA